MNLILNLDILIHVRVDRGLLRGRGDKQGINRGRWLNLGQFVHHRPTVRDFAEDVIDGIFGPGRYYVQLADGSHCRTRQKEAVLDLKARSIDEF